MAKAQHAPAYRSVPPLLRRLREEAGLSQRQLGDLLDRPQSWVYNCETANRRVDITELISWCRACSAEPLSVIAELVKGRR